MRLFFVHATVDALDPHVNSVDPSISTACSSIVYSEVPATLDTIDFARNALSP
jgi:hypothetical protein